MTQSHCFKVIKIRNFTSCISKGRDFQSLQIRVRWLNHLNDLFSRTSLQLAWIEELIETGWKFNNLN
jgi:hypothetical protein